jgi:hypothetical protein
MADSGTKSLGAVLTSGIYRIPNYQRGYAWTPREVNDLMDDLEYVTDNEHVESHYVNSIIVTEPEQSDLFDGLHVIDGQQRLLTSCLLANEILRTSIGVGSDDGNIEHLRRQIDDMIYNDVFKQSRSSKTYRVLPAEEHQEIFKQLVPREISSERDLEHLSQGAESPSEQKLVSAVHTLNARLNSALLEQENERDKLLYLSRLATSLHQDFVATLHEVDHASEAGRIFEAINDRGRALNRADKIKSYLVYRASLGEVSVDVRDVHETFTQIYEVINRFTDDPNQVDSLVDRLIGQHWTMFAGEDKIQNPDHLVGRHEEAKSDIEQIKYGWYHAPKEADDERVGRWMEAYMDSLRRAATAYVHIRGTDHDELFDELSKKFSDSIDTKHVRQCLYAVEEFGRSTMHALSMALYERFVAEKEYDDIAESLERIVMRTFGVGGARRDKNRSDFESLARALFWAGRDDLHDVFPSESTLPSAISGDLGGYGIEGSAQDAQQVVQHLDKWAYNYSHEERDGNVVDTFRRRLQNENLDGLGVAGWSGFSSNELKNYLLYRYEDEIRRGGADIRGYLEAGIYDFTVEHVWPSGYSGPDYPDGLSENEYARYAERLGNLAFLSLKENSSANDADYLTKWDRVYKDARDGTKMVREEFPIPPSRRDQETEENAATRKGFETWSTEVIEWRSQQMAETLADYWGFDDKE